MKVKATVFFAILSLFLTTLTPIAGARAAGLFPEGATPLQNAHENFALGKFSAMTAEMKKALEQSQDPAVAQNVYALLNKAYQVKGGNSIPVDWHLPQALTRVRVSVVRRESEGVRRYLKFTATEQEKSMIELLQIKHYPEQVVIDSKAGTSKVEEVMSVDQGKTTYQYQIKSALGPDVVASGLYTLRIVLKDGTVTDGWFLVDPELNSSDSPILLTPAVGQTLHTSTPLLSWQDFHSPEYQASEGRNLWTGIFSSELPNYDWNEQWTFYQKDPDLTQITVGAQMDGAVGVSTLKPGRYVAAIAFVERRMFGDLILARESVTTRTFFVKP